MAQHDRNGTPRAAEDVDNDDDALRVFKGILLSVGISAWFWVACLLFAGWCRS